MATCPGGHKLPRRVGGLRCSPIDCAGEPEQVAAAKTDLEVKREVESDVRAEIAEAQKRRAALHEVHPVPGVPLPPADAKTPQEYMRRRLEQAVPVALEHTIQTMVTSTGARADRAAADLLDRGGFGRNPESNVQFTGPVLVVGNPRELKLPWNKQLVELNGKSQSIQEVMDAEVVEANPQQENADDHD